MSISEILSLKYPNEINNREIIIQDDGNGAYIKKWNVPNVSKPTKAQILAMANDPEIKNAQSIRQRKSEYGSVEDQLDMLYWDMKNNTSNWMNKVTRIKENNPLEK